MATMGPVKSVHGLDGGRSGVQAGRHQPLDIFQHHDGVVHDDADGQHQPEQRQVVQAEAQCRQDGESADQGDGHVDHRQDHGLPVLQEEQHDQGHQQDRDH